jgi:hypothetical protein
MRATRRTAGRSGPPFARSNGGQIFPAGMLINKTEDQCQHDRTSLFGHAIGCRSSFQADFAVQEKRLRQLVDHVSSGTRFSRSGTNGAGGPGSGLVFNVGHFWSQSSRTLAFGGCSFLRDGPAERHSAVQRIPRSHSSASLRSRSALALSCSARASLRYRIARALLMASQIPTQQGLFFRVMARPRLTSAGANRLEASVQDLWTSLDLDTQQGTRVRDCR